MYNSQQSHFPSSTIMSLPLIQSTLPTTTSACVPPSPPGSDNHPHSTSTGHTSQPPQVEYLNTSPYPPLPPSTTPSPASSASISVPSPHHHPPSPESPYARYQSQSFSEGEDEEGSDVEIYLNDLGLDDSASRMHVHMHRSLAGPAESPVLPAGCESSESISLGFHVPHPPLPQVQAQAQAQTAKPASPKIPSAPTQPTIPLPDASPDFRAARNPSTIQLHPPPQVQSQLESQFPEQNSAYTIYDVPLPSQRSAPFSFAPIGGPPPSATTFDIGEHQQKTPNVYINGLPPHFPEDQLFALASPFGEIRSVRTFTRHVRDSESGYGFVLYVFFFIPFPC
ncbi:hypothetical protein K443DRAFT_509204 [Laccaria amethystina LaAM-08-1]|uniref:RRM domain-containing protein n=1 Tax=Laccaria amethystina LaAM-08-1 TaxID=1095629 RepID=A0A0C9WU79_9AGAR|nr:hypothetical protein K443DRAFT_509204 [Laccaria amethystina LaAM-08-1]